MRSPLIPLAAATLLIGSLTPMTTAADGPGGEPRSISVTGTGKVSAPPNLAEISVGVITQAPTARAALSANSEKMAGLHAALKERGVASKDIRTTNISVQPQFSQPPQFQPGQPQPQGEFVPKIVGYQVQNTVEITGRDLAKLGELLDAVVDAGANQMYGIKFEIDGSDALMDVARKAAMADARKKADLMAGEAGVVVGAPLSIRDEAAPQPPRPGVVAYRAAAMNASVPVAGGEQELSVTVHVVYELKLAK